VNPDLQIERDLVRWPRAKWVAAILAVLAMQGFLFFVAPRAVPEVRTQYPREPVVSFVNFRAPSEWLALQDASLFATANPRGFSGPAWMNDPSRLYFRDDSLPTPAFLAFTDLAPHDDSDVPDQSPLTYIRSRPAPSRSVVERPSPEKRSRLEVQGFAERRLVHIPELPVQYATDAIRPSVVQALVDPDGFVLSSRVIESSGSRAIDNSALELSRRIRFAPLDAGADNAEAISAGKLIFEWYAADSAATNSGATKAVQR